MAEEKEFSSFDETAWKAQDAADDQEIARLLEQSQEGGKSSLKIDDTPFDQSNKADDAQDFEDISDDDLPDEEPCASASLEMPPLTDDGGTSNDADDLFGEGPSSPTDPILGPRSPGPRVRDTDVGDDSHPVDSGVSFAAINFDPDPHFNGAANQDPDIPAVLESHEDLLKAAWPAYKKGRVLTWSELLPAKKATWKEKKPLKKPKHLVTSKLNLDLATDQEKTFRIPGTATSGSKHRSQESSLAGLVRCEEYRTNQDSEDTFHFDMDQESDSETVMGFTLQDIDLACQDWGAQIHAVEMEFKKRDAAEKELLKTKKVVEDHDDEWDAEFLMDTMAEQPQQPKKRKVVKLGLPEIPRYAAPTFDNFEDVTRRGAKRVHLDMNDPRLLLLDTDMHLRAKRPRLDSKVKRMANGNMGRDISQRFNLSNDEAYELLKENHQSKVRATLGNISVEHSMPAIKLSWPYYKVKLGGTTDEYHRPRFRFKKFAGHVIKFDKPQHHKRKMMKGKVHEVYRLSKDLSLSDNSTAVLFEYCEPRPRVLNNFGMGSKLINYYRRKDNNEDDQLPKQELGEYRMLLPEDRSPFSLFGTVDSGETVPTLHNEMYRAPVFKHTPRGTDFLVVRSTTGVEGSKWHLHKIDHLHVVGQTFPSVDVPGPHSRRVTNASKNRMKMLAFRMIRHSQTDNCQLSDITKHIADSTDTQNRQKLKEFLQYDRESGEKGMWRLKPSEILPDENAIRAMIKPEEVSLLDAMQLGIKELEDAGYDPRNANIDDDVMDLDVEEDDDDEAGSKAPKAAKKPGEKQEETLADKMAPWKTTKAFIDACASKAMLQLHGEGDPTGHGLGFSFIRTSMKGGYIEAVQGPLATSADAMEREKRANGGHAYNVKKQQAMYEEGIREIWEKQKATLSNGQEHEDKDVAVTEDEDDRFNVAAAAPTPAQYDDGTSQISGFTSASRHVKKAIRITREVRLQDGTTQRRTEVVHDPVVISQYMKRRTEADLELKEYVIRILRSRPRGRPPLVWKRLPLCVKALHKWACLADTYLSAEGRQVPSPGATADLIGLELRAPAYLYLSTASTAPGLRAMPTMTALQALGTLDDLPRRQSKDHLLTQLNTTESKRSSNDSRRTRPDDRPENSKKSSTKKPALATQDHPVLPTRCLLAQLASVPTVDKLDTSRQTKSIPPPVSPPPYPSFDWWAAASCEGQDATSKKKKGKKKSVLRHLMKSSDREARAKEQRHQIEERAAVRLERRDRLQAEKRKIQQEIERQRTDTARLREQAKLQEERAREEKRRQQEALRDKKRHQAAEQQRAAQEGREERRRRRLELEEEKQRKREEKAKARPRFNYGSCRR
ncbi:transcription factor TFIID complex subunit Taf111 [Metarhizium rileyi]|uniref:Transcription factor TFIID complex subunit Taf111 n=1 Tax=Metarhizium rileyi (strain RCEF 4871) TaxID=1649241 RepID=A0A167BZS6_METRR|nr:transcription factor TFIID complex subunit Taf111 [Metarhizium rileyi RCEF 4871]